MRGKIWKLGLCGLLTLWLGACAKPATPAPAKVFVGVACYDSSDVFIAELTTRFTKALRTAGDAAGCSTLVTTRDAADSPRLQNEQVKELLDAGCNVLAVNLVDRTDTRGIIELAKQHHVPVIFFNREPVEADLQQWRQLYYVGGNAQESGRMQGELAAAAIKRDPRIDRNHDGKIQYVVLEGELGHQDAIIRTEEATDTLRAQGLQLDKLGYGIANWQRAQAENRMEQLIGEHQKNIELVLANNDAMALGGRDAYLKLNRTSASMPLFFGIDGTTEGLQAVKAGELAGTVYNNKEAQAKAMATLAVDLISGGDMHELTFTQSREVFSPYFKVTAENVGTFLK